MSYPNDYGLFRSKPSSRSRLPQLERCSADESLSNRGPIGMTPRDSGEYANIRSQSETRYQMAIAARNELFDVRDFRKSYTALVKAISDTHLGLDENDKPTLKIMKLKSLSDLVDEVAIKKLGEVLEANYKNKYLELVKSEGQHKVDFGKSASVRKAGLNTVNKVLKFNVILNAATILHDIHKYYDGIDLAKHQTGSRKKDADNLKARYCFLALAASMVRSKSSIAYTKKYIYIYKRYYDYEKKINAFHKWENIEYNLKNGLPSNQRRQMEWKSPPIRR